MIKTITSVHNSLVKDIAKLDDKYERYAKGYFVAEGLRTCGALIQAGARPLYIFAIKEKLHEAAELYTEQDPVLVSRAVLKKISHTTSPSGIVGVFFIKPAPDLKNLESGLVMVDISDPGNMGTLIRTCAALNKKSVVCVGGVDPYHPKVVQASAGSLAQVHLFQMNWDEFVVDAQSKKLSLCALVVRGGKQYEKISFDNTLIVVGNEAHGLPEHCIRACDQQLTLAMPGGTESLNAAVAGSIALYLAWGITHVGV
jgi:RNA methyltransferase, TrmH family